MRNLTYLYLQEQKQLHYYILFETKKRMKKASPYAYVPKRSKPSEKADILLPPPPMLGGMRAYNALEAQEEQPDLNVFALTFNTMKEAEKNLAGGDPYNCKKCKAILNKYSKLMNQKQFDQSKLAKLKIELKEHESLWVCQFCQYPNLIAIEKEEIPQTEDIFYMLESAHQINATESDSTMVFCIDASGSMNTTSEVKGKIDLKFGLSKQEIDMLKAFMEPGDQAQFNFLPGQHNKDKTFISRKQCILSAIQNHLQQLKKHDPFRRVGFVTFNNEVNLIGDNKANNVCLVGDKLNKREEIINSIKDFKLSQPLAEVYDGLIDSLNKTQAKGQTALGPALLAAIQVAAKGSPGSTVTLCTDGLANIGLGILDPLTEEQSKFYEQLAVFAKESNISVNIMTIKGEGCKMEVIGKLAEATNGNMKVVNPEKLSDDFANVMKDQVVGLNVITKIMLHKAMAFRNQDPSLLKENKTILVKELPNATVNTKISFQYELRPDEDLQFLEINVEEMKTVPFQAQIQFTSPKGGRFLRVVSSESKTTNEIKQLKKEANLPVVHHRIGSVTAQMYSRGDYIGSQKVNSKWSNFLADNFVEEEYQEQQKTFVEKNTRLNKAIQNKHMKQYASQPMEKKQINPKSYYQAPQMESEKIQKPMMYQAQMYQGPQIQTTNMTMPQMQMPQISGTKIMSQLSQSSLISQPPRFTRNQQTKLQKPKMAKMEYANTYSKPNNAKRKKSIQLLKSEIKQEAMEVEQENADSDEDQVQLMDNLMEKGNYKFE